MASPIQFSANGSEPVQATPHSRSSPSSSSAFLSSQTKESKIWDDESVSMAASGRLAEILSCQAATLLPSKGRGQPDLIQITSGSKLISLMYPFSIIEELMDHYFLNSQVFTVAAPLISGSLPHVKVVLEQGSGDSEDLSRMITENTLRPLIIPASMTAASFHTLFTGPNLRWEFVGFLFACAGRSAMTKQANSSPFMKKDGRGVDSKAFVHEMMMASRTCVALCRQNGAAVNDILIWLLYENLLFSTMHYGDSSMSIASVSSC